ncbi:hypothetical protein ACV33G_32975, partial [Pseudomonas aeruginosa]
ARCREPLDVLRIARHLRQQGLEVGTLPPFYAETPAQAGFLFGFGCIERDDIDPALDLLRAARWIPATAGSASSQGLRSPCRRSSR